MAGIVANWNDPLPAACQGGAITIGNFDGVHLGHRALVAEARRLAREVGGPAVAVTFDPHPMQLLAPERFQPLLTTPARRAELLRTAGADAVVLLRTDRELLRLSPADFFARVVAEGLRARAVVEGFNFRFGRGRAGDTGTLRELCASAGIRFRELPPRTIDGETVSSSRVRAALRAGDVRKAARCLGRPYRVCGRVGTGQRRGRSLGFPTANLEGVETLVPGEGVYAVRARAGGGTWPAAANVGPNPTFGEPERKIEVHLIGFDGDLYGQELAADFVERLRDTRPFAGVEELVAQLREDVARAQAVLRGDGEERLEGCPNPT